MVYQHTNTNHYSGGEDPFDAEIRLDTIIKGSSGSVDLKGYIPRPSSALSRPVFVVGSPRSGTTVIGKSIANHKDVMCGRESMFLLHLWHVYADLYLGDNNQRKTLLGDYVTNEELLESMGIFSDRIFGGLLEKRHRSIYLDHTPWYGAIASFIKLLYPDARFIHTVRDGRQVARSLAHSYRKGYTWAGSTLEYRILLWRKMVETSLYIQQEYPDSYLRVDHSNIIHAPERTFKDIFSYLSLEFSPAILGLLSEEHSSPSSHIDPKNTHLDFDADGWPLEWDSSEKELFREIAGKLMERLYGEQWERLPRATYS